MWVHASDVDYYEGLRAWVPPGEVMDDEGVYALASSRVATREVDGVVPMSGRNLLRKDGGCYWVTGVVSSAIRGLGGSDSISGCQEFLLVAGEARLVARTTLKGRDRPRAGERITVGCRFELVASHDWSVFDLPEEWAGDWRVEQMIQLDGSLSRNYALDLAAVTRPN